MTSHAVPRLVVAAPSSGSGKTTVATGLIAALRARGLRVSPHKVGPDYIDPGYHSLAAGRPGRNLDPWLVGEDRIAPLFLHGAAGADVAVVEGVMGLFDGHGGEEFRASGFASTAHVARLLGAPVVLVVDVARQSRSVAALVQGFAVFEPGVRIGGVILNRVGSDRHEELCREALEASGVPVLGAIRRDGGVVTPSRHLGLIPAAERGGDAVRAVERLGALVAESCDLDALLRLAATAPPPAGRPWDPAEQVTPVPGRPVVAVAGGPAFTFSYAEHVELLRAAGADVAVFDPLRDEALPDGTAALVIGGGFPEVHAHELAANAPMLAAVAAFGGPVAAECAGLLYLCEELDGRAMCGRIPGRAAMTSRLTLGYREAVAMVESPLTRPGERFRGHEFHRTALTGGAAEPLFRWSGAGGKFGDGFGDERITASYLHLHWAGYPEAAQRLVSSSRSPSALR
ncbi:cobyrinic acid a,c-diamide synthase [Actinomadura hallensis]|uniref:Hydrogenobyrinate a,c-diamide synthase n=1 Tax=Actinomadura hallensis TaxID=337895 RepID=A0A543I9G6_9ACTN|nr:cobyrinate a,c-diamide synthase [Actinomadura hallensis]TQM67140.1 cobyrinic acid a,c-diamide synthase [Actinomadura hallensis]